MRLRKALSMMAVQTDGRLNGLKAARAKRRITQLDLADAAGVGIATIIRAEAGRVVSSRTLARLADALDVSAATLLGGER